MNLRLFIRAERERERERKSRGITQFVRNLFSLARTFIAISRVYIPWVLNIFQASDERIMNNARVYMYDRVYEKYISASNGSPKALYHDYSLSLYLSLFLSNAQ